MFSRLEKQKYFSACLAFLAAVLLATAENLSSETCVSGEEFGENQAFLQLPTPRLSESVDRTWKLLENVGFCRSEKVIQKWRGPVAHVGNRSAADCWYACTVGFDKDAQAFHTFSNDGTYTHCHCIYDCKCMAAATVASTMVRSDFKTPLPGQCTDCPKLAGTYVYSGPTTDPEGILEIQQNKCFGIVAGRGRFVSFTWNDGRSSFAIHTVFGSMENHGFIYGVQGNHSIILDKGYTYHQISDKCKCRNETKALAVGLYGCDCGHWHCHGYVTPSGWDFLGEVTCSGRARLFHENRIPSMLGGHGTASLLDCADYASRNHASMFSFSSCPPPIEKFALEAQACGKPGCINKGRAFRTFSEAWNACGRVQSCGVILKWRNGKYYLRRSTDPTYQRRRALRNSKRAMPYHCPEERNRCDIWNTCAKVTDKPMHVAYQKACPSVENLCDGSAECLFGCECPMCGLPHIHSAKARRMMH